MLPSVNGVIYFLPALADATAVPVACMRGVVPGEGVAGVTVPPWGAGVEGTVPPAMLMYTCRCSAGKQASYQTPQPRLF
jgi:hypothetical protein